MDYDFSFVTDDLFMCVLLRLVNDRFYRPADAVEYAMMYVPDGDWREHWNNKVLEFIEENCPPRLEAAIDYVQAAPDYWRGASLSHTEYSDCIVGVGENQYYALESAIEQGAEQGLLAGNDIADLEKTRDEWDKHDVVDKHEDENIYCIVRLRVNPAYNEFITYGPT